MNIKNLLRVTLLFTVAILISCSKNNNITPIDCTSETALEYTYMIEGSTTVSYGGQTARLQMAGEIMSALAADNTTADQLIAMFDHQEDVIDFTGAGLNESSNQIKNKTASYASGTSQASIHAKFDAWFTDYATNVAPAMAAGIMASPGVAGMADNRELNALGMEYDQIIAKSLIGALCLDQVANGYLSDAKIGDGIDNTKRAATEDNNATAMEHHWDEGFGYVYGLVTDNKTGDLSTDGLLGKYLNKYDDHKITVFDAFKKGRQAIVENCSEERDRQAQIIKETLSKVVALRAESYLRDAAAAYDLTAGYFHALSEGYGFILSLQFTHTSTGYAYFTNSEVNNMLTALEAGMGFWDRTDSELIKMADAINAVTGL